VKGSVRFAHASLRSDFSKGLRPKNPSLREGEERKERKERKEREKVFIEDRWSILTTLPVAIIAALIRRQRVRGMA
jgi:hypothetical protein